MTIAGETLIRRTTLILRDGRIESVFYPVFPPDSHAAEVLLRLRGGG
jgi:peroxiredoxin